MEKARDPQTKVALLEALGESQQYANEMARAESSFRAALETGETAWGESLRVAGTITKLGEVVRRQNRLDMAVQLQGRAMEIRQRWAPDSLEIADSLHYLIGVAWARGDLETISSYAQRAVAILERLAPDSLAMATALDDLSRPTETRGLHQEATAVLLRALAILERRSPDSLQMATTLAHLGSVAGALGDTESAVDLHQRALSIRQKLAPESLGTASILSNLGTIARDRGDLAGAAELYQRSLTIWKKAAPSGLGVAGNLDELGVIALLRGNLAEAWNLHSSALEIFERLAPASLESAYSLSYLGMVAEARGDLKLALDLHQQSEKIYERVAPGTIQEALVLQQVARLYRRKGDLEQAAQLLGRGVEALESQVGRMGGSQDLQAAFRARYEDLYRDAIEIELERGHAAEAFALLERSRARSFLALLAERDLSFAGEVPAALERSRKDNAALYDKTLSELARWNQAVGEEAREALHRELGRLRRERDEIAAAIRKASPRLAALRQPQPLDLAAARNVLDAGTLALSYSIGEHQTALFAVTREGGLRVEILPLGEEALRRDVERFLAQVRQPAAAGEAGFPGSPAETARSLYRSLIAPVADLIESSERVVIVPDGPLHRLPFGALIRNPGPGQYLTEWKPLHTALSLTAYATLREAGGKLANPAPAGPVRLVAFGDPRYPKGLGSSKEAPNSVRGVLGLRNFNWEALPYTRGEVERIAEIYPGARLYLGEEATEEQAKSVSRDVRILHFATHGYIDDRSPLDSALVLTIPEELPAGRDNGLLQVWEIFESVRLDADLVVLSACESALGRELSGEGMIGLTRAFQYAGARSVVASLWSVADQVTAELMARFHRHRAAGLAKDEALRAAQVELIREPIRLTATDGQIREMDASAPFFWAAFQLFGDWR